jgi:predicted O-methyltransferase YrrM
VAAERAERVFEVGFAMGLSTLHIAAGLVEGGAESPHHIAVDPTEGWLWHDAGTLLVEAAGLDGIVEVLLEQSQLVLPRWKAEGRQFDIAFIDGDHRFDPCFLDIAYGHQIVRPGGLVVVDDMWMPSVRMAVAFFEANLGLELQPDAVPDGFRWTPRPPWRKVRPGKGQTAVLRKPMTPVQRGGEHFVPFW